HDNTSVRSHIFSGAVKLSLLWEESTICSIKSAGFIFFYVRRRPRRVQNRSGTFFRHFFHDVVEKRFDPFFQKVSQMDGKK
ncbi:MAG: hypothetical protein KJO31_02965, partial [Gammaproteobacteria bacterium]|nr:hypothetical protein [Gammaproteobacteria bacterium]